MYVSGRHLQLLEAVDAHGAAPDTERLARDLHPGTEAKLLRQLSDKGFLDHRDGCWQLTPRGRDTLVHIRKLLQRTENS
jgi:Mn-dependent DtxR family transcriptional regulator